jgi:formylglycine-generating enzyme required for sulfatase activity
VVLSGACALHVESSRTTVVAPAGISTGPDIPPNESSVRTSPNLAGCPSAMRWIAGGWFDGREIAGFCMDESEVTVAAYRRCVEAGTCEARATWRTFDLEGASGCNYDASDREDHPMNCVSVDDAVDFCLGFRRRRLPGAREWLWAARGRDEGRIHPWGGDSPTCARAVMFEGAEGCGRGGTAPVASRRAGVSRDGLHDLAGNVWEWTLAGTMHGGGWNLDVPHALRSESARRGAPGSRFSYTGFRCVFVPW